MKTARVIITFDCRRNCHYCVNNYSGIISQAIEIKDINEVSDFDEVLITGGEPMLYPQRTLQIIRSLKKKQKKFLYTAQFVPELVGIIPFVDGLHYTLHEEASSEDIHDFHKLQTVIFNATDYVKKSFRLYINQNIIGIIQIIPMLWKRVEVKSWLDESECKLPANETLFILKGGWK